MQYCKNLPDYILSIDEVSSCSNQKAFVTQKKLSLNCVSQKKPQKLFMSHKFVVTKKLSCHNFHHVSRSVCLSTPNRNTHFWRS